MIRHGRYQGQKISIAVVTSQWFHQPIIWAKTPREKVDEFREAELPGRRTDQWLLVMEDQHKLFSFDS